MSSGQRRSKRNKKGGHNRTIRQAMKPAGERTESEEDQDKERLVPNRGNRRAQGERGVIAPTIGGRASAAEVSTKDILRMGKLRKGKARTPEHVARWSANREARSRMSTQSITILEPVLGKQVHLLKTEYRTALDVANEWNYPRLSGIKGIGPAFLQKLHTYLTSVGFQVNWKP